MLRITLLLLCFATPALAEDPVDRSEFAEMIRQTLEQNLLCACQSPEPNSILGEAGLLRRLGRSADTLTLVCAVPRFEGQSITGFDYCADFEVIGPSVVEATGDEPLTIEDLPSSAEDRG